MQGTVYIKKKMCWGRNSYFRLGCMPFDAAKAGVSDELEDSVNYGEVCHFIREFAEGRTFKLLESLGRAYGGSCAGSFPAGEADRSGNRKAVGAYRAASGVCVRWKSARGWHQAFIALGSNMGDKKKYLDDAVKGNG